MCFRFGSDPRESFLSSRKPFAAGESSHSLVGGKANLQNDIGITTNHTIAVNGTKRLLRGMWHLDFEGIRDLLTSALKAPRNRTIDPKNNSDGDRPEL
jgi:hypothetical protein